MWHPRLLNDQGDGVAGGDSSSSRYFYFTGVVSDSGCDTVARGTGTVNWSRPDSPVAPLCRPGLGLEYVTQRGQV